MEDRIQVLLRIQPVLRIEPTKKMYQHNQRMQDHTSDREQDSESGFSKMLAAERGKLEQETTKRIFISSNYGKDAKEITEYISSWDFRR